MSILSHHITRAEAPVVRRALIRAGYGVTLASVYGYVATVANNLEPMHRGRNHRVTGIIGCALRDAHEGTHHVDRWFADEEKAERQNAAALAHADSQRIFNHA